MTQVLVDLERVRRGRGGGQGPRGPDPIADLGLLDEVEVDGGRVTVRFHLTSPLCPAKFADAIGQEIRRQVARLPGGRGGRGGAHRPLHGRGAAPADVERRPGLRCSGSDMIRIRPRHQVGSPTGFGFVAAVPFIKRQGAPGSPVLFAYQEIPKRES